MARITKTAAKVRIAELSEQIRVHDENYYVLNAPVITDFEYDLLMSELITLEKKFPDLSTANSPTKHVGSDITIQPSRKIAFTQVSHQYPMLSLSNTYNIEELEEFRDRIVKGSDKPFNFSCELKFDGTAICLTYKEGKLERAVTRGDGIKGDDVTDNIKTISSIPQQLHGNFPPLFEIRGEIYMPFEAFYRLNAEKEENDETPFANPRNAAAGSLKLLDSEIVGERGLQCVLYHLLGEDLPFTTHSQAISAAASWGLPVSEYSRIASTLEDVYQYINEWDTARKSLPFPVDGIVIKVNQLDIQRSLGMTARSPRWATAYKFKPDSALTQLLSIDYQIGRTGAITPVANLEPVLLAGTVIKRASVHNKDQMDLLDLHIGDYVYIEKGGEIIPKITKVELSRRPDNAKPPKFPTHCPDCGTPLVRDEDMSRHYCPNPLCPTQIKALFVHFVSRKAMDILCGEMSIEQLYEKGLIRSLSDLYTLNAEQLISLEGWKDKSSANFLASIEKSKQVPFERTLYALGIRHIGESTAKMLARKFKTIDALAAATVNELAELEDIGLIVAQSIESYFHNPDNISMIKRLKAAGVRFELANESQQVSNILEGCNILVSGVFSISRDDLKAKIEAYGGHVASSVSKNLTYIIAGSAPGAMKMQKAEKLGIKIISESDFYNIIYEHPGYQR